MTTKDIERIVGAIVETNGFECFALVIGVGDQTVVLINNCCASDCSEVLAAAATSIEDGGGQRPALFN